MGITSIWHWLIVLLIVVLLFGAGKLPKVMGDLAKGIKNFKAGLKDEEGENAAPGTPGEQPKVLKADAAPANTSEPAVKKDEAATRT